MPFRSPAALFAALLLFIAAAAPARAVDFTDAAGRRVTLPDRITRVMPAERNAEVMILVLAPDKLAGVEATAWRSPSLTRRGALPVLGWRQRSTPQNMALTARQLRPNLIIDAGAVTPERAAFADQVQQLTGIPYILVDDSFARTPAVLRSLGVALDVTARARDLGFYAEHSITGLRGRLLIRPADARPRVYFARGADGLTTSLPGSPAGEALDEAGAINVANVLGRGVDVRVAPQQLYAWDPAIIIAEGQRPYDAFRRNPAWRRLSAVRNNHVYLEPTTPFGWIEDPSGINRLIGLYWLSSLFYPDATEEDLRTTTCDFYDRFYGIKLTNAQLEGMLRPAGAPPTDIMGQLGGQLGEPLFGLGAAPPATLPAGAPGAINSEPNASTTSAAISGTLPKPVPTQTCAVPQGPSPIPIGTAPGAMPDMSGVPGVPPPGRRGRPPQQ
ncbi:MAG TPA: ABC transporter substrate-binding protein [Stellaceae bacterium]|jgi:iron complex transport system substrate-binding protein|nr:ABC transporter substrate-binding protein [Stellaceae bacterium]